jgi:hypothetical protein
MNEKDYNKMSHKDKRAKYGQHVDKVRDEFRRKLQEFFENSKKNLTELNEYREKMYVYRLFGETFRNQKWDILRKVFDKEMFVNLGSSAKKYIKDFETLLAQKTKILEKEDSSERQKELNELITEMKLKDDVVDHWMELKSIIASTFPELNRVRLIVKKKEVAEFMMKWLDTIEVLGGFKTRYHDFQLHKAQEYYKKILVFDYKKNDSEIYKTFEHLYTSDHLICLRIKNKLKNETEEHIDIKDHIVVEQLKNLKSKYVKYGGGIEFELIEGANIKVRRAKHLYLTSDSFKSYYVLLSISTELLKLKASEMKMKLYNNKKAYYTQYIFGMMSEHELEPVRFNQRIEILMYMLNQEFDLEKFKEGNLIHSYYPLHNNLQRRMISKLWWDKLIPIYLSGIINRGRNEFLRLMTAITLYHGPQQGYYFGFLLSYTNIMFFLMVIGIIAALTKIYVPNIDAFFILVGPYIVGIWSSFVMIRWKMQEKELNYSFNIEEDSKNSAIRKKYDAPIWINRVLYKIERHYISKTSKIYLVIFLLTIFRSRLFTF